MAPTTCPATSRTRSNAWGSKLRPLSCENPRATASQNASYRRDLEERAEHIQQVLSAVLLYVDVIVRDTASVAPGGSIDREYLTGLITDLAGDIAGSIANAAEECAAANGQFGVGA